MKLKRLIFPLLSIFFLTLLVSTGFALTRQAPPRTQLYASSIPAKRPAALKKVPRGKTFEQTEEMRAIAQLTSAMLSRQHYAKRDITPANSRKLFDFYLKTLDPLKLYFTKDQVDLWRTRQDYLLPALASNGDITLALAIFNKYLQNLEEYEEFVKKATFTEADFKTDAVYQFDRLKSDWPENKKERTLIWRKKLTNDLISIMLQDRIKAEELKKENKSVSTGAAFDRIKAEKQKNEGKTESAVKPPIELIDCRRSNAYANASNSSSSSTRKWSPLKLSNSISTASHVSSTRTPATWPPAAKRISTSICSSPSSESAPC